MPRSKLRSGNLHLYLNGTTRHRHVGLILVIITCSCRLTRQFFLFFNTFNETLVNICKSLKLELT